jgi:hypothetical protein
MKKGILILLPILLVAKVSKAGCITIQGEEEFDKMQMEIMEDNPTGDISGVMSQRIQICMGKCGFQFAGPNKELCIFYPESKKKNKRK